jgi:hypothetical protein
MNDCHVVDFTDDGDKVNEQLGISGHLSRKLDHNATENSNACMIYWSAGYCHTGGWAEIRR